MLRSLPDTPLRQDAPRTGTCSPMLPLPSWRHCHRTAGWRSRFGFRTGNVRPAGWNGTPVCVRPPSAGSWPARGPTVWRQAAVTARRSSAASATRVSGRW